MFLYWFYSYMTMVHTTQLNVPCVIDLLADICFDFTWNKYCYKCETNRNKLKAGEADICLSRSFAECQMNSDGSSEIMETEGEKVMWSTSAELNKIILPIFSIIN